MLSSWGIDEAGDALDEAIAQDLVEQARAPRCRPRACCTPTSGLVLEAARQAKLQLSATSGRGRGRPRPRALGPRSHLHARAARRRVRPAAASGPSTWSGRSSEGARVTHEVEQSPAGIRALSPGRPGAGRRPRPPGRRACRGCQPSRALSSGCCRASTCTWTSACRPTRRSWPGWPRPWRTSGSTCTARPFDFVLEYAEQRAGSCACPVYDAYSPFYPPFFAMQRERPAPRVAPAPGASCRRSGCGFLRIFTPGGEPVHLQVEGEDGAIKVPFGHHPPAVMIHPNGRVLIVDGKQAQTSFLVPRWPVIRGKDHAVLYAKRSEKARKPSPRQALDARPAVHALIRPGAPGGPPRA